MNSQTKQTIPPELPDSPIEAWRHYYICMEAEEMIKRELDAQNPDSLMVGTGIGYRFIPRDSPEDENGTRYYMAHGYQVGSEEEYQGDERQQSDLPDDSSEIAAAGKDESEQRGGLDEDFIDTLFERVQQLFLQYAPEGSGEYLVSLEVTSAHFSKPKLTCQGIKCDFCSKHKKKHIFRKVKKKIGNNEECVWVCTGSNCKS
jgi:hypothetical protein